MVVGPEEASVVARFDSYVDGHEQAAVVVPDSNECSGACRESIALPRVFRRPHPMLVLECVDLFASCHVPGGGFLVI